MSVDVNRLANKDWKRFSRTLDLFFCTPDRQTNVTAKGIGTERSLTFETDGQDVVGRLAHSGVHEQNILDANPTYPTRNVNGRMDMMRHLVRYTNSQGKEFWFRIVQQYPNETTGMMMFDMEYFDEDETR